jgi:predicted MFS family arabinose efflux permease
MTGRAVRAARPVAYSWLVFALTFGLLISDYMARQVLNAVFPLLKAEWALSDTQLGALSGIVALMVGLLTFPLSLLADRWGRIRSLTAMAVLWSIATLICGIAQTYPQMFAGRMLVGLGEAAYGSVGIAVVVSVFPKSLRATLSAAFMAGGLMGQVLGVGIGGQIAEAYGWRAAFMVIALAGLALAVLYPMLVRSGAWTSPRRARQSDEAVGPARPSLKRLFAHRSLLSPMSAAASSSTSPARCGLAAHLLSSLLRPGDRRRRGRAALYLLAGGAAW